jgi:hypothetical protein
MKFKIIAACIVTIILLILTVGYYAVKNSAEVPQEEVSQ